MNEPAKRSRFITGLAWTFIVLAGFSTLIAILQNVMLSVVFANDDMRVAMSEMDKLQPMPPMFHFMFENIRLILAAALVTSALTLVASIGLLKRRNWARLVFIGIMAFAIVSHLAGVAMPFIMPDWMSFMPKDMPADVGNYFAMVMKVVMVFSVLVALITVGFCIWVIKHLLSEEIRKEFLPT